MVTTEQVHIYLSGQGASTTEWIHALSIPRKDIERLTLRPLQWLRFAPFTVCGAKGDFPATPGGEIVDYGNVSFDDLADKYYYAPCFTKFQQCVDIDMCHFIDHKGFNDESTSSAATPRRSHFRGDVCTRDQRCVVTRKDPEDCDAAHIIPRCKGSDYISYVVRDRSGLYERLPTTFEGGVDINCVENGILLRKHLHSMFGWADIGFLMTPNFAMVSADVPQIVQGPIPPQRTTLQHMERPTGLDPVLQRDVRADWYCDGVRPPPSILLDFMFGVAVVKRWKCDGLDDILEKRFQDDFHKTLENATYSAAELEDDESAVDSEDGDRKGPDYVPPGEGKQKERRTKEKEQRSQERSCEKVRQWLDPDASVSAFVKCFPSEGIMM